MRTMLASLLTFVLVLGASGLALRTYAKRHFLPSQHMQQALAAGDGCVLFLGDSRMEASFDAEAFHRGLRAVGPDRCHAALAVGATDIAGHFFTAREYLAAGRRPAIAVLGIAGDSLLGPEHPLRPEELVGNNVIHLEWTRADDVFAEVPGFPFEDLATFDAGFRFLVNQASPFGRYQSLISVKTQALTARLTGRAEVERNRFGALADMTSLEGGLRARAPERLASALRARDTEGLGIWFPRTVSMLGARGARFLTVELPMRRVYRDKVTDLPETVAYHAWLANELAREGHDFLDLSHAPFVEESLFADALHLGPAGAALVSEQIGRRVGALLRSPVNR